MRDADHIRVPGLGYAQCDLVIVLKRRGPSTTAQLAEGIDLAMGTLREHIRSLEARRLVERVGRQREGLNRTVGFGAATSGNEKHPGREGHLTGPFTGLSLRPLRSQNTKHRRPVSREKHAASGSFVVLFGFNY